MYVCMYICMYTYVGMRTSFKLVSAKVQSPIVITDLITGVQWLCLYVCMYICMYEYALVIV